MSALKITRFGERITARWTAGNVKVSFNGDPELQAFALAAESPLYIEEEPDGAICLIYLLAAVVSLKRTRDRLTWSNP